MTELCSFGVNFNNVALLLKINKGVENTRHKSTYVNAASLQCLL